MHSTNVIYKRKVMKSCIQIYFLKKKKLCNITHIYILRQKKITDVAIFL